MKTFRRDIWEKDEYKYAASYGFMPNIRAYLHDDESVRNCILVVPGGGYCMVVPPEAEIVAKEFFNRGMNAFVLTYTTDITMSVPLKKQPLMDISRAVRYIRKNSEEFFINPNKLVICGFSAGGHVCGSLGTHFEDVLDNNEKYKDISNRPDAMILSYPVITTGKYTHIPSVQALIGREMEQSELDYFSIEKNVTSNTPPCFLWQTVLDDLVPVENTYLMAKSLKENNVPYAQYVFPFGNHGLSVATEDFFKGEFGEPYTFEQLDNAIENVKNGTAINVSEQRHDELMEQFFSENANEPMPAPEDLNPFPDVRTWPDLAMVWMSKTL